MPTMFATVNLAAANGLAFIEGLGFDPFIRGLLSVMVGVVVLIGGTYLLVATNSGSRTGGLIAGAALFGWMFLMGIFWTAYGIGWRGQPPTWELVEINAGHLDQAENEKAQDLGFVLDVADPTDGVTSDDRDIAQQEAVDYVLDNQDDFDGWRYLSTSDPMRGEAQSSAAEYLAELEIYETPGDYLPLTYGTFNTGGKPLLDPDVARDDPDKNAWVELFTDAPARALHKLDTLTLHLIHPEELMVVQVQGVVEQASLPGEPPPVATIDESDEVYSVIMRRDRGGPVPWLFGGLRFTPAMFTIFNGILFAIFAWSLHNRDKREAAIRAAA